MRLRPPQPESLSWKSLKSFQESEEEAGGGLGGLERWLYTYLFILIIIIFFCRKQKISSAIWNNLILLDGNNDCFVLRQQERKGRSREALAQTHHINGQCSQGFFCAL